jgi:hypothetical protein
LAQAVLDRISQSNALQGVVDDNKFGTIRVIWEEQDNTLPGFMADFPALSMMDIQDISLGTYQLGLAPAYTLDHLSPDGKYKLYYYKPEKAQFQKDKKKRLAEFKNILYLKFQSRHSNATKYKTFIR